MLEKSERAGVLEEVFNYLYNSRRVTQKSEFADQMGYARAYMSSAMNGNEDYLSDKLMKKILQVYPGVFNPDYILDGKGDLLSETEKMKSGKPSDNITADMLEMYAQRLRLVDDMRTSLHEELNTVKDVRGGLEHFSAEFTEIKNTLKQIVKEAQKLNSMRYTTPAYVAGQIVAEDAKPAEVTNPVTSPNSSEQA